MRSAMRVLALVGLVAFGLGLLYDVILYLRSPCSAQVAALAYILLPGVAAVLMLPLALFGSALAVALAVARRQWGWLAGLLIASLSGLVFIETMFDSPSPFALFPVSAFIWLLDHAFGITCSGASSPLSQAIGFALPLVPASLVLLAYSYSGASVAPARTINPRHVLWVSVVISLALNILLSCLRLTKAVPIQDQMFIPPIGFPAIGSGGITTTFADQAGFILSPIGVLLAYILGLVLIGLALRKHEWIWAAVLVAAELVTVWIYHLISVPSLIIPLTYQWPTAWILPVVAPIPLPLASLAYVWWTASHPARTHPSTAAARPVS